MAERALISVQAAGRAAIGPDLARVHLGCMVEHDRAAEAFEGCSSATAAVIAALRNAGLGEGAISTSGIQLTRRHDNQRYLGTNNLAVTVRPPERTGEILGIAVGAGADALSINNLEFGVADDTEARSRARAEAVRDAYAIANELAGAAGVTLGRLVSLDEGGGFRPHRGSQRMAPMAAAAPVEIGDQEVVVSVAAVFEIA
jgi:uncharacterized protein YggE